MHGFVLLPDVADTHVLLTCACVVEVVMNRPMASAKRVASLRLMGDLFSLLLFRVNLCAGNDIYLFSVMSMFML